MARQPDLSEDLTRCASARIKVDAPVIAPSYDESYEAGQDCQEEPEIPCRACDG